MKITLIAVRSDDVRRYGSIAPGHGAAPRNLGFVAFEGVRGATEVASQDVAPVLQAEVEVYSDPGAGMFANPATRNKELDLALGKLKSGILGQLAVSTPSDSVKRGELLKRLLKTVESRSDAELEAAIGVVGRIRTLHDLSGPSVVGLFGSMNPEEPKVK